MSMSDRSAMARALVREGCIGETLAAVDASARFAGATDPAVRAALARIVRDESSHAALAWRALRWMVEQDPPLAEVLDAVFLEERESVRASVVVSETQRAHGLIGDPERHRLRAWEEVIGPSWAELTRSASGRSGAARS